MGAGRLATVGAKIADAFAIVRVINCTAATFSGGTLNSMISKLILSQPPMLTISRTVAE